MTKLYQSAVSNHPATEKPGHGEAKFVPTLGRSKDANSKLRDGLVVSSDGEIRQAIDKSLEECGLTSIFASTVAESWTALARHETVVVVCNEWLPDGSYADILQRAGTSRSRIPVVVVSRIGDWPEYLRAVYGGVFDYVAYPTIRGELVRVIRNALVSNTRQLEGVDMI